ncbi:MAG: hypothetical protein L6R42_009309 [Xanthoria sp. 1 TBL-2021]|nr:MAG: hypothetical protein L6R42_009309 [Xanthoria sp. 1 TBL-2021]
MMADIFGKASRVLVWLGPDPHEDTDLVFSAFMELVEMIATLHAVGGKIEYLEKNGAILHWTLPDGTSFVSAPLPSSILSPSESEADRLRRFFNLPWFSRSWVLQEAGLATLTTINWGGRTLDWNAIGLTALFLSKTVQEVYRDFAREHIERTISLDILTAVQHDCDATAELPFPSWVPQWNKCNGSQSIGFLTSDHFASANRDAIVTSSADTDPDTLIARGMIVSKVVYTSSLCDPSSFEWTLRPDRDLTGSTNAVADTWIKSKLSDLQARGEKYPRTVLLMTTDGLAVFGPESDILAAYMRTWVAGKNLSEVDDFDLENDISAYWHCLWASPTLGTREYSEDHMMRAERYRLSAAAVADQRKLFIVGKGLFGLGPGAMKKGDWVAVLLGGDVPFIIREVGGEHRVAADPFPDDVKFQLVGECYVQGLMTGAAVKGVEVTRDIVLI